MNSIPEAEVLRLGLVALDVECVGVGECLRIAIRRGTAEEYGLEWRNHAAAHVCFLDCVADVVLDRSLVTQEFFYRPGDLAGVVLKLLPLVGVTGEDDRRVAEQLGDGLGTRPA